MSSVLTFSCHWISFLNLCITLAWDNVYHIFTQHWGDNIHTYVQVYTWVGERHTETMPTCVDIYIKGSDCGEVKWYKPRPVRVAWERFIYTSIQIYSSSCHGDHIYRSTNQALLPQPLIS